MRLLRVLVVLVLPTCLMVLAAPVPPATACSCVGGKAADFADWADAVFVGTLDEVVMPPEAPIISSVDPVTYEFDVAAVYEGEPGERTHVRTVRSSVSCGLEGLVPGRSYVVFASHQTLEGEPSEALWVTLCGGTAPAGERLVNEVETVLGPASPPQPGEAGAPAEPLLSFMASVVGLAAASAEAALEALTSGGWTRG